MAVFREENDEVAGSRFEKGFRLIAVMLGILFPVERFGSLLQEVSRFPCEAFCGREREMDIQKVVVYFQPGFADGFERAVIDGYDQPVFDEYIFPRFEGGKVEGRQVAECLLEQRVQGIVTGGVVKVVENHRNGERQKDYRLSLVCMQGLISNAREFGGIRSVIMVGAVVVMVLAVVRGACFVVIATAASAVVPVSVGIEFGRPFDGTEFVDAGGDRRDDHGGYVDGAGRQSSEGKAQDVSGGSVRGRGFEFAGTDLRAGLRRSRSLLVA